MALFSAALSFVTLSANAELPSSVNLIVPYKAGGGVDAYARALRNASMETDRSVFTVLNRPGAGGVNGALALSRAPADGKSSLLVSASSFLLSSKISGATFDPLQAFTAVAKLGSLNTAVVVPINSPHSNVEELLEALRENPDAYRWSHPGRGSFHYLSGVEFLAANGLSVKDVPFNGGASTRVSLMGEHVNFSLMGVQQAKGFTDFLQVLAVDAAERHHLFPNVPTFKEVSGTHEVLASDIILFVSRETDPDLQTNIKRYLETLCLSDDFARSLEKMGLKAQCDTTSNLDESMQGLLKRF
ncbi:hypothetical protein NBRC116587_10050 [Pseudoteredinibacter isoporae]